MSDEAWAELHAATPPGWHVGRPMFHDKRDEWQMYAFDTSERPDQGGRKREWTAIGPTEERVIMGAVLAGSFALSLVTLSVSLPAGTEDPYATLTPTYLISVIALVFLALRQGFR